jgi:DNA primase large subunit
VKEDDVAQTQTADQDVRSENLRDSAMMAHLMDALDQGTDIGHYGRLVFTMIARWFMPEDEIVGLLAKQPDMSEEDAKELYAQVKGHDYNPPKRNTILDWQKEQDFQICPNADDPDACNVYSELRFPDEVYERIGDYWEQKADAQSS